MQDKNTKQLESMSVHGGWIEHCLCHCKKCKLGLIKEFLLMISPMFTLMVIGMLGMYTLSILQIPFMISDLRVLGFFILFFGLWFGLSRFTFTYVDNLIWDRVWCHNAKHRKEVLDSHA